MPLRPLTPEQLQRIERAEEEFKEAIRAHNQMRDLLFEGDGWTELGPSRTGGPSVESEIRKLEHDVKKVVIQIMRVLAETTSAIQEMEVARAQIEKDGRETLHWALGQLDGNDIELLDITVIETELSKELTRWVQRLPRELPAPWQGRPNREAQAQEFTPQASTKTRRNIVERISV